MQSPLLLLFRTLTCLRAFQIGAIPSIPLHYSLPGKILFESFGHNKREVERMRQVRGLHTHTLILVH